ncbi:hypothetical protein N0V90_009336 [Kalmusia sp. IMI 367209]|nr:hypothetical protein N0V90_009336 [Kalmusia sp. IMI 367209]
MSAPYTGPGLSLHVTFHIDPAKVPAFLEALKPAYDVVTAEPECIFFEVFQMPDKPGVFKFVEDWNASMEWLVNLKKEYYKPYLEATEPLYLKPREFEIFERMPENQWVSVKEAMLK